MDTAVTSRTTPTDQAALEAETAATGRANHIRRTIAAISKGRAADTDAGTILRREVTVSFADDIEQFMVASFSGRPGHRAASAQLLNAVCEGMSDAQRRATVLMFAAITVDNAIAAAASHEVTLVTTVAGRIGSDIATEIIARGMAAKHPGLITAVVKKAKAKKARASNVASAVRKTERKFELGLKPWTDHQQVEVGTVLIERLAARRDLITIAQRQLTHTRKATYVEWLPEIAAWFDQFNEAAASLCVAHLPMIETPTPWTGLIGGGYRSDAIRPLRFVKRFYGPRRDILENADLSRVYAAVNAVQGTAWRVNAKVLTVAADAWSRGIDAGGLPLREPEALPECPEAVQNDAAGGDLRRAYREEAEEVHTRRRLSLAPRMQVQRTLDIATRFANVPAFYYPCQVDFRGRVYYVAQTLSPQSGDLAGGLLTFASGKPLGVDGIRWLAIHGANVFGLGKVSFAERIAWAHSDATKALVRRIAENPLGCRAEWAEGAVDEPWQFLAWCLEWSAFLDSGENPEFVSSLPVGMDGSCNGIQHYAAMLRDEKSAADVNLLPSDAPRDVYKTVADITMAKLRSRGLADDASDADRKYALTWATFGIDRSITKRAVMTLPYGAQHQSRANYVKEAVEASGRDHGFGADLGSAVQYLTSIVSEAMREAIVGAYRAMGWLQRTATDAARENHAPTWTTPSGFVVVQDEREEVKDWRIPLLHGTQTIQLRPKNWSKRQDIAKHRTAIAPNFVQSLDAAHLVLSVNEAAAAHGIGAFSVNHDSYGTHAADAGRLAVALRTAFVGMYQRHDVLAEFGAGLPTDVKAPPKKGKLDLNGVMSADYFFA